MWQDIKLVIYMYYTGVMKFGEPLSNSCPHFAPLPACLPSSFFQLYRAIVDQEVAFFDTNRTGDLTNRLSSDTQVLQNALTVGAQLLLDICEAFLQLSHWVYYISQFTTCSWDWWSMCFRSCAPVMQTLLYCTLVALGEWVAVQLQFL